MDDLKTGLMKVCHSDVSVIQMFAIQILTVEWILILDIFSVFSREANVNPDDLRLNEADPNVSDAMVCIDQYIYGNKSKYSGGSNTEHSNSEPIKNQNVLKIGIGMVETIATAMY